LTAHTEASLEGYHAETKICDENDSSKQLHKTGPDAKNIGNAKADVEVSPKINIRNSSRYAICPTPSHHHQAGRPPFGMAPAGSK